MLFEIFADYFRKVGNDVDSIEETITPIRDVWIVSDTRNLHELGSYSEKIGIVLNAASLQRFEDGQTLIALVHEYLHEISTLPTKIVLTEETTEEKRLIFESTSGLKTATETHTTQKTKPQGRTPEGFLAMLQTKVLPK